ncbi:MAG: cell division ATP-binding protein FtsE [Clostridia bacterium]|nr:cell division ATP-binding protein FtsE [Clostridia bacterium]
MIEFNNISKIYDNGTMGVKDINLSIDKGEFAFIVGSSGSGKTTLFKLLLKEIAPSKGTMKIKNKDITFLHRKYIPFLRRKIGVVFQDFRLLPNKTVYENVAYAMQVSGAKQREIRRNVPMVLSMVGIENKAKSFPHELSGGQQQKVALARAIVNNPDILLADEPTGNLDPQNSWEIMKLLNDINHRGTTVVVVTHDKELVDGMKKRVIELEDGSVIRDDQKGGYSYDN